MILLGGAYSRGSPFQWFIRSKFSVRRLKADKSLQLRTPPSTEWLHPVWLRLQRGKHPGPVTPKPQGLSNDFSGDPGARFDVSYTLCIRIHNSCHKWAFTRSHRTLVQCTIVCACLCNMHLRAKKMDDSQRVYIEPNVQRRHTTAKKCKKKWNLPCRNLHHEAPWAASFVVHTGCRLQVLWSPSRHATV